MNKPFWPGVVASVLFSTLASAADTEIQPLSGMGVDGEAPVYWDFRLDQGRGSGEWRRIPVPSQWEQQGFGTYYYGTQARGKPDSDPLIPKETATYRRSFDIPAGWKGRAIHLVFEAVMTDTTVRVNGQPAGPTHQGGFYRFSYDITRLVKPGSNQLEVVVAKESADTSVNRAERRGDYWTFGGIYRPVWLEARPALHIDWTAIDARANGEFLAWVNLSGEARRGTQVTAQVFDARGQAVGAPLSAPAASRTELRGRFASPATWSAETPNLYSVRFTLQRRGKTGHELTQRFGFRTIEVRANDGVYLNGRKIMLKGVNRHAFRPASGRTLTRAENRADAQLIKDANMNAVRMSHYPPDPAFLEAADELGLYVLDELAGWQGYYDTAPGRRLIGQIVRRDVNHPSILFWDNGNEGGWNTENDGEFARWDPQQRKVLHPWGIHDDINTDHYERFDSTVKLSAGPQIFMPTEFLHGLYDGGIGAGLEDYWRVMSASPTVAGGFFWSFADECVERTDRELRLDCMGNAAPDGIVGPRHEKEGSFHTVREIWSPVQLSDLRLDASTLRMRLRNAYDFVDLSTVTFGWRRLQLPAAGQSGEPRVLAAGEARGPNLPARASRDWSLPVPGGELGEAEVLELTARSDQGRTLWQWTVPGQAQPVSATRETPHRIAKGRTVSAGRYSLEFLNDGTLGVVTVEGRALPLRGPWPLVSRRKGRGFESLGELGKLQSLEIAPRGAPDVLARMRYDGPLRSVTWRLQGDELVLRYELDYTGDVDLYGIRFEGLADTQSKRWVGQGPFRIWKNRIAGTQFGLHELRVNDPVPGETFDYPEFPGFFGEWRWLQLQAGEATVVFRNLSGIPRFGLGRPQPGKQPVIELPDLGWSFLHVIPPIGTKFDLPETLGPQSQTTRVEGRQQGELALRLLPR